MENTNSKLPNAEEILERLNEKDGIKVSGAVVWRSAALLAMEEYANLKSQSLSEAIKEKDKQIENLRYEIDFDCHEKLMTLQSKLEAKERAIREAVEIIKAVSEYQTNKITAIDLKKKADKFLSEYNQLNK